MLWLGRRSLITVVDVRFLGYLLLVNAVVSNVVIAIVAGAADVAGN